MKGVEWLSKEMFLFYTAVLGFLAALFKIINKKQHTHHAKSFIVSDSRNDKIEIILSDLVTAVPHLKIVSLLQWRNNDKAKSYRCLKSTDFSTWMQFKEWQTPEDALIKIQAVTLSIERHCLFIPNQLKAPDLEAWFQFNNIEQCASIRIAIDDKNDESLILYLYFDKKDIFSSHHRTMTWQAVGKLYDLYKPEDSWIHRKLFVK